MHLSTILPALAALLPTSTASAIRQVTSASDPEPAPPKVLSAYLHPRPSAQNLCGLSSFTDLTNDDTSPPWSDCAAISVFAAENNGSWLWTKAELGISTSTIVLLPPANGTHPTPTGKIVTRDDGNFNFTSRGCVLLLRYDGPESDAHDGVGKRAAIPPPTEVAVGNRDVAYVLGRVIASGIRGERAEGMGNFSCRVPVPGPDEIIQENYNGTDTVIQENTGTGNGTVTVGISWWLRAAEGLDAVNDAPS
ncbi:Uu.00g093960.m01.CDS01 [Anthostomella pinea]|uniref:Uu.00g093960.m01.CDS01 n=1 Tax=Anthostomella pinea TaxID=933095 RepID=A0AAI8VNK6_9PEZI|nr:Uu.00g093960.m01.CDS01 [Anthostomella pinea]